MRKFGFTLIELMVAVIIAGLVAFMAWELVKDEHTNYTRTRTKVRLQSDAKEAFRILEGEFRNLGFNTVVSVTAGRSAMSASTCSGAGDARIDPVNGDSSGFRFVNSTTIPGGDQIEFRVHTPPSINMNQASSSWSVMDCNTNLQSISYRWNNGRIERRLCDGAAAVATCAADSNWVPLIDSVVSFQIQYGLLADTAETWFTSTEWQNAANWANPGAPTASLSSRQRITTIATRSDTAIAFGRFDSNSLRHGLLLGLPADEYRNNQTLLVSFHLLGSTGWLQRGGNLYAGFFHTDGTVDSPSDTLPITAGIQTGTGDSGIFYQLLFQPSVANADLQRVFGIMGKSRTGGFIGSPLPDTLFLRNLSIRRISQGGYFRWLEEPNLAQKNRVKAVRLTMLVKSRRTDADPDPGTFTGSQLGEPGTDWTPSAAEKRFSYILMQRIIPVVNNGNL